MRKYIIHCLIMTLFLWLVTGCEIGPGPKDVLSSYLDASLKGRYEEAYNFISASDKAIKSLNTYLTENDKKDNPFALTYVNNISFNILNVTKKGDKAYAEVEITLPDFSVMFKDIMGAAFESAFGNKDDKEIGRALAKKYEKGEVPLTTKKEKYELVKEKDGWKVFLDWETKKKINEAMTQAKQLEKEKKLYAAKEKYQEVLELDSKAVEASEKIKHLDKEIKSFKEKQAYIDKVKITRLEVAKAVLRGLGVFGEIKNLGNRSLKEVEITIYFLDKNGKPIFEETYHPVLVTEYSFGDRNKPLKPNYTRKFGYSTDDVPSDWAKKVQAKITDIEFE